MKKDQKIWNKNAKKVAYFQYEEKGYTYVKINGLVTPIKNEKFNEVYEVLND